MSSIKSSYKMKFSHFFARLKWANFSHSILNDVYDFTWFSLFSLSFLRCTIKKIPFTKSNDKQICWCCLYTYFSRYVWVACMYAFFFLPIWFVLLLLPVFFFVYIPCFYYEFNDFITSSIHSCVWKKWWWYNMEIKTQINLYCCCCCC